MSKMPTRDAFFRCLASKRDLGLEIGPSYNPAFPKADGWNIETVDHLSAAGLREKYRGHAGKDVSRIEEVDFVIEGSGFSGFIPKERHGQYDYIALSHAIEHLCDIVGFLAECDMLLKEGGKIIIAAPDKRFCFDFFRPLSTTGAVLRAHWENRSTHPADALFDSNNLICATNGQEEWVHEHAITDFRFILDGQRDFLSAAARVASGERQDYIDMHRWVFTPSSLLLILRDLVAIGLSNFEAFRIDHGAGPNIFVALTKNSDASREFSSADRMAYQFAIMEELRVQQIFVDRSQAFANLRAAMPDPILQRAIEINAQQIREMT